MPQGDSMPDPSECGSIVSGYSGAAARGVSRATSVVSGVNSVTGHMPWSIPLAPVVAHGHCEEPEDRGPIPACPLPLAAGTPGLCRVPQGDSVPDPSECGSSIFGIGEREAASEWDEPTDPSPPDCDSVLLRDVALALPLGAPGSMLHGGAENWGRTPTRME